MNDYLLLVAGFLLLFVSGHTLIESSVSIARRFNISNLVIGITVVAFGTSAPELFVSLKAVFVGSADISISNVVGSNIANIALVLGFVTIIFPLKVEHRTIFTDWAVMMFASLLLYFFSWNNGMLNHWEGIVFIVLLIGYMSWLILKTKTEHPEAGEKIVEPRTKKTPFVLVVLIFVASVFGLYYGSGWLVESARNIALSFGISERVVGITVIAFGTSVPELATSLIAAIKKNTDISIGNIIGSNIFNIFAILGITSTIKNINVNQNFIDSDYFWMMGIALLLLALIFFGKRGVITRFKGALLVLVYVVYIYFLF